MKRLLTIILLLCVAVHLFGQKITIDTLFIPKTENIIGIQSGTLKFPVIRTGNLDIDKSINKDLKNRFTSNEYPDLSTDSTLIKWCEEQIVYLNFEVTYLGNALISFNISAEGCGAYCSGWTEYYTYSTLTGKYVTILEIVDTTGKFRELVQSDKNKQYEQQKLELKKLLQDKNSGIDETTYQWALEQYNSCDDNFTLNTFSIHTNYLEIIAECSLPNAIKNLTPTISLKYRYQDIKDYLKTKL